MSLLQKFLDYFNIYTLLDMAVILVISLPFHEFAHALTAYLLGDDTAKRAGRLTLNPLKHLDPIGAICLLIAHFGWAKPTPVDPSKFKNRKGGMAITAIAGPVSNLLLAFVSEFILLKFFDLNDNGIFANFFYLMAVVNIGLAVFNLIPINPLDGSRILALILPERVEMALYRSEQWMMVIVMLIIFSGVLNGPLNTLIDNFFTNFGRVIYAIPI